MRTGSILAELDYKNLRKILARYQQPSIPRSLWQLANTLVPYMLLWYLLYLSLRFSYCLTLALSILAAGFMMRTFIIFHDCGHGSLFKSRQGQDILWDNHGVSTLATPINTRPPH